MNSEKDYEYEDASEQAWEKYQQEVADRESTAQYHEDMGVDLPSWSR
jgi:hypothetical protein